MNDFERKLRQQPFRTPPPDLRAAIFGAPTNVIEPARWTWRDWFWPSPQAWAGLAAVWIVFAALTFSGHESAAPLPLAQHPPAGLTLLTLHRTRDLNHVLELAN
jgi:hypothetical protein